MAGEIFHHLHDLTQGESTPGTDVDHLSRSIGFEQTPVRLSNRPYVGKIAPDIEVAQFDALGPRPKMSNNLG